MGDFWEVFGEDLGTKVIDRDYLKSIKIGKTVHEIEDIQNEYSVSIIENVESKYVYRTYTNNGNLTCQEHTGTQYSWDGKTVLILVSNMYFAGNGIWRERPTGF